MVDYVVPTTSNEPVDTALNIWYGLAASVSIDALIYEYASRRYYFTLTGDADGTTDIEIPVSSIQCRRRNGEPTYLFVNIPDITNSSAIAARPNGDMIVEMSYWYDEQDNLRTEIARATMEDVRMDEGGQNQTITLSGHKTEAWVPKTITTDGSSTYRAINKGKLTHRLAEPDTFINPGDTVTVDSDTFVVGNISIIIGSMQQTMEVAEA